MFIPKLECYMVESQSCGYSLIVSYIIFSIMNPSWVISQHGQVVCKSHIKEIPFYIMKDYIACPLHLLLLKSLLGLFLQLPAFTMTLTHLSGCKSLLASSSQHKNWTTHACIYHNEHNSWFMIASVSLHQVWNALKLQLVLVLLHAWINTLVQ